MTCTCNDAHNSIAETIWHRAYRNWYDADRAGSKVRALAWGLFADRIVRWA